MILSNEIIVKRRKYEKDRNHHRRTPTSRIRWQHRFLARYPRTGGTIQETRTRQAVTDKRNKSNKQ
nr:MAG TPA: hypothetical protein [Caudoviricetes sp.]